MLTKKLAATVVAALALAGCSALPLNEGNDAVRALGDARGLALPPADAAAEPLPDQIDHDTAVRLALSRNPELIAALASIGFGAADVYEAARIANPMVDLARLDSDDAGRLETYGIVFAFTDLLTLGARRDMAAADFTALQHDVAMHAMQTAVSARHAWFDYAAALELEALQAQVSETGIVSAELATRFRSAGNLTPRELAEQQAAAAALRVDAIDAARRAAEARAALADALGISSGGAWQLSGTLQQPPADLPALEPLLDVARTWRLDLAAARLRADAQARRAGVENWSRWLGGLAIGGEVEREPDGTRLEGPSLSIGLPVFDTGRGRIARQQAALIQAGAAVQRVELDIENGLRRAHARLAAAHEQSQTQRDVLLPARARAVSEAAAQYNFMLIGVFELLEVKQREIAGWQDYVASVRAYWHAHLELAAASGRLLDVPPTVPLTIPGAPVQPMMPNERAVPHNDDADPHAGHDMSRQHDDGEDPHAGHDMPKQQEQNEDPHAGHDMPEHHDHGARQ
ncbi:MAG: TolC family protein [Pseudomonadota bacterium]